VATSAISGDLDPGGAVITHLSYRIHPTGNTGCSKTQTRVIAAIPAGLGDRLAPPEVFHEMLEHRWYLSEQAGHDVGTTAAARSYFETALPRVPEPLATGEVTADL
jgi:uncharacterized protein DUF4032